MSAAPLRWSPASTPRPPEYCGRSSDTPNSGEKYAVALTGSPYGTSIARKKPVIRHHERNVSVQPDIERDDRWYQRAVFYEVLVRGFSDASADGNGDLRGLAERLDYLGWLGV